MRYLGVINAWTGEKDLAIEQIAATLHLLSSLSYGELTFASLLGPAPRRSALRKNRGSR